MIPKIIHYCWFGRGELPELAKKCIASWKKYCPDYEIIQWNEDNFDVYATAYTRWCYEQKKYAFLSDYVRLAVVGEHGGIYFDTDVEVVRSFDELLSCSAFFGFENDQNINTGVGFGAERAILRSWQERGSDRYAGIVGLDADLEGHIIGTPFPDELSETTLNGFYMAGGKGDKKQVYWTDIMKSLPPYPVFDGEKYFSLGYKYLLCDQKYQLIVTNIVLANVEYQPDGSSATMVKQYLNNPKGFAYLRTVHMQYPSTKRRLFITCIHYVSSSIIARNRRFLSESPRKALTVLAIPFGVALTCWIRYKAKEQ